MAHAPNDTPSEREQTLAAERDLAVSAVRALLRVFEEIGGHMAPEHQRVLFAAMAIIERPGERAVFAAVTPAWAKAPK